MGESLSWFRQLFPQLFVGGEVALRFLVKLIVILGFAALVIVALYLLTKWLKENYLTKHIHDGPNQAKVVGLVGDSFFFFCLLITILSGIHFLGFETGLLLAAIAFGLGFAFQDILGNTFAGLIILTNNDYKLGDIIEVDHEQDYFGRIEELTIRYTVLRTVDLRRVIVPNIVLITYPVRTYEIEHTVRYEVSFTVHYASDIALVEDTTIAAVNTVAIVNQPDLSMCLLHAMGDRGLEFVVYAYIDPKCGLTKKKIRARLTKAIYTALHDAGIVIVYPHRSLTIDHEDAMLYETVASLYS